MVDHPIFLAGCGNSMMEPEKCVPEKTGSTVFLERLGGDEPDEREKLGPVTCGGEDPDAREKPGRTKGGGDEPDS